ncbi:hypothetical protein BgiMline_003922, partial [Biomphalaria glabrata]
GLNGLLNMRSRKKDEHFKATEGTLNISLTVERFYRSTNDQHVLSKVHLPFLQMEP